MKYGIKLKITNSKETGVRFVVITDVGARAVVTLRVKKNYVDAGYEAATRMAFAAVQAVVGEKEMKRLAGDFQNELAAIRRGKA